MSHFPAKKIDFGFVRENSAGGFDFRTTASVHCKKCDSTIRHRTGYSDPADNKYVCYSCPATDDLTEAQFKKAKEKEIGERFYVVLLRTDEQLSKLCEGSSGNGRTHLYTRPMTEEERLDYYRVEMAWKISQGA